MSAGKLVAANAKAWVSAAITTLTAVNLVADNGITPLEWAELAGIAVGTWGFVWGTPNRVPDNIVRMWVYASGLADRFFDASKRDVVTPDAREEFQREASLYRIPRTERDDD